VSQRRLVGRALAAVAAVVAFTWAGYIARATAIPELGVYDGYRMIVGSTIAVALVGPVIWRWRRDRALIGVALAASIGCVIPLIASAVRHHIPVSARLKGAWILAGADLVGPAMVVGFVCLWLALREWTPGSPVSRSEVRS
jgi:hypothetical protein